MFKKEHQRRPGYFFRQKTTQAYSVQVDGGDQLLNKKEQQTIELLSGKIKVLTSMVVTLMDQQTPGIQPANSKSLSDQIFQQYQVPTPLARLSNKTPSHTKESKVSSCANCCL